MGKVAALASDFAILTSDNPRTEDPLKIIEEVERGIQETGRKKYRAADLIGKGWTDSGYLVIPDRRGSDSSGDPCGSDRRCGPDRRQRA